MDTAQILKILMILNYLEKFSTVKVHHKNLLTFLSHFVKYLKSTHHKIIIGILCKLHNSAWIPFSNPKIHLTFVCLQNQHLSNFFQLGVSRICKIRKKSQVDKQVAENVWNLSKCIFCPALSIILMFPMV